MPDTKAKLYRRFVTTLYQWKKPRVNWIQQQDLNAALGKLALSGMLNETSRFQLRESVGYRVMGALQFELACRLGWLNLVARDAETLEGIYAFYHPTFQEYFAALAVEDWHFFLNHIPKNPQHPDARYRILRRSGKRLFCCGWGVRRLGRRRRKRLLRLWLSLMMGAGICINYGRFFLAAAGIAEFKTCSLADEIVSQIIQWGFGYFNEEKQQWQRFIDPLAEGSKEILKQTDRERASAALVELIRTSQDEFTRMLAAQSLGEIDNDNPVAIAALVELIRASQNEFTRKLTASFLGTIGKDNPVVIATLLDLIRTSQEDTRIVVAQSLGEIDKDNPVAIEALVNLIRTSQDKLTRINVAFSLGKIGEDNPVVIATLLDLIRTSQDEDTRMEVVSCLGKIGKGNPVAISALLELIRTS